MSRRPPGVTIVCVLAILGAIIDLITSQRDLGNMEEARWVETHAREAQIEQLFSYFHAGITLLVSYFILQTRNWARWFYLLWNAVRYALSFTFLAMPAWASNAEFLKFRGGMIPGFLFYLVSVWLLCRADTRKHFANPDRPWWQDDDQEEET